MKQDEDRANQQNYSNPSFHSMQISIADNSIINNK